jgi:Fic family protein
MHIEIREYKGLKKYYLAHSYRKNGKVRKIRIYLGSDLSGDTLDEKRKAAETRVKQRLELVGLIRDPYLTALAPAEMKELAKLEKRGAIKISHLSEEDWLKFTEAFTYDTNAIEGSTVEAKEVADVLERKKWPEDRSKAEIAETYGVSDAIKYIRKTKEHLSLEILLDLHRIVFKNSKTFAGKFRKKGIEVVIADASGNIVHRGAPATEVRSLLRELVEWYAKNRERYSPLVLAAVVHNQFENIHPFQDGNGRIGRLLLNNILLKHGLPPVNIELKNRSQYYAALQAYENEHDLRPTLELILKEYRALKKVFQKR